MEAVEPDQVPRDKFVLLIDNRQEQRLIRIADNKYSPFNSESSTGGRRQSLSNSSRSSPSTRNCRWVITLSRLWDGISSSLMRSRRKKK